MAPSAVRMVLMEGQNADGVTVDQDQFDVDAGSGAVSDQVVSAILGTRESAQEGGYRLTSTGVVVGDQAQAGLLRQALADRKVRNVTLVSAFLAAAALTQATGGAIGYTRTALLFVQPDTATLAAVDSADGAVTEVYRAILPADDSRALAELAGLTARAADLVPSPDGVFVVGSGVNVGLLKPALQAAARLPVSVPEEPDLALARGAALASAHTPLLESSTSAVAWARDPGTGHLDPDLAVLGYADVSNAPVDYDATTAEPALAYSAVSDNDSDPAGLDVAETKRRHRPLLLAGSALAALVVAGAATLVIALAVGIRPMAAYQPVPVPHVVPAQQEPASAPQQPPPEPPPPSVLPPEPSAPPALLPEVQPAPPAPIQPPVPVARQVPAPAPAAPPAPVVAPPAPAPAAPAPLPAAPAPVPAPAAPAPLPLPIPIPLPILLPAPIPAPAAPAPWPATPKAPEATKAPAAPKAPEATKAPAAPKAPAPALPPIFSPPTQSPPKTGGDRPGSGGGQRGGGLFPGWPGQGGGQRGGGLFPGWPGSGGKAGNGGSPGLGGGGSRGGLGGFRF